MHESLIRWIKSFCKSLRVQKEAKMENFEDACYKFNGLECHDDACKTYKKWKEGTKTLLKPLSTIKDNIFKCTQNRHTSILGVIHAFK